LDRYWRKSRREEERLRGRKDTRVQASRLNTPENASGVQEQQLP